MRRPDKYIKNRESQLVSLINSKGEVTVEDVCAEFEISPSTARNLLNSLKSQGLIDRTHGGAIAIQPSYHHHASSSISDIDEYQSKLAVGELTTTLIKENDIIAICGGTTTHMLAKFLKHARNITVVTNSLLVAYELMDNTNINVRVSGGILNPRKGSLYGPITESFFKSIRINKFIFSADAINVDGGATVCDSNISDLERQILSKTETSILIADSSKFQKKLLIDSIAYFDEIDYMVTDNRVDKKIIDSMNSFGVETLIAEV